MGEKRKNNKNIAGNIEFIKITRRRRRKLGFLGGIRTFISDYCRRCVYQMDDIKTTQYSI
jgi:hypothetical protein